MSTGVPEWVSVTVVDAVQYDGGGGPRPVRCQVGVVRTPGSGDTLLASQVAGQPMVILPPHSATKVIRALREGLSSL